MEEKVSCHEWSSALEGADQEVLMPLVRTLSTVLTESHYISINTTPALLMKAEAPKWKMIQLRPQNLNSDL